MNTTSSAIKNTSSQERVASNSMAETQLNTLDALAMIDHGSELTLSIITPVGTKFLCQTAFIGTHSNSHMLIETPQVSTNDLSYFFQPGFWIHIRAISSRGEGAKIYFRCQLQHLISEPAALLILSMPSALQISALRQEPRYEVNLSAKLIDGQQKLECQLKDLSQHGCCIATSPLSRQIEIKSPIHLEVYTNPTSRQAITSLTGTVCNTQRSSHYARYGLKFDEAGHNNAKTLLESLQLNT